MIPGVHTVADDKPSQATISVAAVLAIPAIQHAVANLRRWTPTIKAGVANALSNRVSFNRNGATAVQNAQFDQLMAKVETTMNNDQIFADAMDPSYVIVDFAGAAVPAAYRAWLDTINAKIGGTAVGAVPGHFNVGSGGNELINFLDPNMNNLNLLHINNRSNADHVADQLLILGGLSAWVLETKVATVYR